MPKYFPSISHSLVKTVKNREAMEKSDGSLAIVSLCFGSDTDRLIVLIKRMPGPISGVIAELPGHQIGGKVLPSFVGKPADELKVASLIAFDRVKQKFGLKWAKQYKVDEKTVEELQDAQSVTTVN